MYLYIYSYEAVHALSVFFVSPEIKNIFLNCIDLYNSYVCMIIFVLREMQNPFHLIIPLRPWPMDLTAYAHRKSKLILIHTRVLNVCAHCPVTKNWPAHQHILNVGRSSQSSSSHECVRMVICIFFMCVHYIEINIIHTTRVGCVVLSYATNLYVIAYSVFI